MVEPKINTEDIDEHINQLRGTRINAEIEAQNQRINIPDVAFLHALRIENAKLKEALRECITPLTDECEQHCDWPCDVEDSCPLRVALAKAREVLGDA